MVDPPDGTPRVSVLVGRPEPTSAFVLNQPSTPQKPLVSPGHYPFRGSSLGDVSGDPDLYPPLTYGLIRTRTPVHRETRPSGLDPEGRQGFGLETRTGNRMNRTKEPQRKIPPGDIPQPYPTTP